MQARLILGEIGDYKTTCGVRHKTKGARCTKPLQKFKQSLAEL